MLPNHIAIPVGANVLMALALIVTVSFTVLQVIATVPAAAISVSGKPAHVLIKTEYSGIVAWISRDSIKITDTYGVSRIFAISESTSILKNGSETTQLDYTDVKMLSHVRISSLKDGNDEHAQVVIVL